MGKKILVYTALFGNYDKLLEPEVMDDECDYVCVTDNNDILSEKWDVIYVKPHCDSVEMNRQYKMLPHRFFADYDISLYIDANVKLKGRPSNLIKKYMASASLAFPRHFKRNCIYDEAMICLRHKKITKEQFDKITEELLKGNRFPSQIGLAENNILIRNHHDESLIKVMEDWWLSFKIYAPRDQLTLMYLLWKNKSSFVFMEESSRNKNSYFSYHLHKQNITKSGFKNMILLMASRRHVNILNNFIARIMDKL